MAKLTKQAQIFAMLFCCILVFLFFFVNVNKIYVVNK